MEIGAEAAQFPETEYIMGFSLQCTVVNIKIFADSPYCTAVKSVFFSFLFCKLCSISLENNCYYHSSF